MVCRSEKQRNRTADPADQRPSAGILSRHVFNEDQPGSYKSQQLSLNAKIGGKHKTYLNVTDDVISSPDEFAAMWLRGLMNHIRTVDAGREDTSAACQFKRQLSEDPELLTYTILFLKRTYWRNCEALSRKRPRKEEAALWIGQKNANYGLLITPRFKNGEWENDVSEIRHFQPNYWSIGHVLKTGLLVPHRREKIEFPSVAQYLAFFQNVLVRQSGSPYEMDIAERYCRFVRNSSRPQDVPLLIPELRYNGLQEQHKYRLDFTIINPYTLQKQGFELSPWSTHGYLSRTREKNQRDINNEALKNFERDMDKHKEYYRKFNIFTLIYTDSDLQNMDAIFQEMERYLRPTLENRQFLDMTLQDFARFTI